MLAGQRGIQRLLPRITSTDYFHGLLPRITSTDYFHGDNGAGLGATRQTGWTGLVADLIRRPDPFATDASGWQWCLASSTSLGVG